MGLGEGRLDRRLTQSEGSGKAGPSLQELPDLTKKDGKGLDGAKETLRSHRGVYKVFLLKGVEIIQWNSSMLEEGLQSICSLS